MTRPTEAAHGLDTAFDGHENLLTTAVESHVRTSVSSPWLDNEEHRQACPVCGKLTAIWQYGGERGEKGPSGTVGTAVTMRKQQRRRWAFRNTSLSSNRSAGPCSGPTSATSTNGFGEPRRMSKSMHHSESMFRLPLLAADRGRKAARALAISNHRLFCCWVSSRIRSFHNCSMPVTDTFWPVTPEGEWCGQWRVYTGKPLDISMPLALPN